MITVPTVLILGAGSSSHVGYPLGKKLVSDLCFLRKKPITNLPCGWTEEYAKSLLTRLSRSGYYSIDAFLETEMDSGA